MYSNWRLTDFNVIAYAFDAYDLVYFNFCRFRALAYTTLDILLVVFFINNQMIGVVRCLSVTGFNCRCCLLQIQEILAVISKQIIIQQQKTSAHNKIH